MILNRKFYTKVAFLTAWWNKRQMQKMQGEKLFKAFKLHKTEWPNKLYFYSPRLKGKPRFTGDIEKLSRWKESKICGTLCPTNAIKVSLDEILIDDVGCIRCGICVELAPDGLLELTTELPAQRS